MVDLDDFVNIAIDAALIAGKEILNLRSSKEIVKELKKDGSYMTNADIAADIIIKKMLCENFPSLKVITEESVDNFDILLGDFPEFVLVDPLDGTHGYIKYSNEFTVNIALIRYGIPVVGVVYAPSMDLLFWSDSSRCSWSKKVAANTIKTLRVKNHDHFGCNQTLKILTSSNRIDSLSKIYIDIIKNYYPNCEEVPVSSSLKFVHLASGEADIYPRLKHIMLWDIAAGDAILRSAGGCVYNLLSEDTIDYQQKGLKTPAFIATSFKDVFLLFKTGFANHK